MAEPTKPAVPVMGRQGIMSLSLKDKGSLYAAYMPFIKNGGLFIPSVKSCQLGDDVFILLTLMDETEKIPVAGRIIWVTPKGAQGNRPAGFGVQFIDMDGGATRNKIEGYLAGLMQAERATHTL